jgi:hypothetical protein
LIFGAPVALVDASSRYTAIRSTVQIAKDLDFAFLLQKSRIPFSVPLQEGRAENCSPLPIEITRLLLCPSMLAQILDSLEGSAFGYAEAMSGLNIARVECIDIVENSAAIQTPLRQDHIVSSSAFVVAASQ